MGMEWFRDLSITIMGFVTTAVLIFVTILVFLLYRKANAALQLAKSALKIAYDTVSVLQQGPVGIIFTLIQGFRGGFKEIKKMFNKEGTKGGKNE